MTLVIRTARTSDVGVIHDLVQCYTANRVLLAKARVTLYEDIQEFFVAEVAGQVVGCGALHVIWEDLAEVRTLAVNPGQTGAGVGGRLLGALLDRAKELGIVKVFCLTFERDFFANFGFVEIEGTPISHEVYEQLLQSYDEGVAEFLDLERVKPNTLGNYRMLLNVR